MCWGDGSQSLARVWSGLVLTHPEVGMKVVAEKLPHLSHRKAHDLWLDVFSRTRDDGNVDVLGMAIVDVDDIPFSQGVVE